MQACHQVEIIIMNIAEAAVVVAAMGIRTRTDAGVRTLPHHPNNILKKHILKEMNNG